MTPSEPARTEEQNLEAESVSFVIPAYNVAGTLRKCVESILAGSCVPSEIIIVDDGSTDGTAEIVSALEQADCDRVRSLRMVKNLGPAAARNAGAALARGTLLFFLDADTQLDRNALEQFEHRIREADAVCGVYDPVPLNKGLVPEYKAHLDSFHFSRRGITEYDGFSGYCAGVRASAFAETGGFDENLVAGMDVELEEFGYRFSREHRTLLDPSIRARHCFPAFGKLTRLYLRRVSQWTGLFLQRRRFERAGDATASVGLATISMPLAISCLPLAWFWPPAWLLFGGLLATWGLGYRRFFGYVWLKRRSRLLPFVVLNGYFSCVVALGAAWGFATFLARTCWNWIRTMIGMGDVRGFAPEVPVSREDPPGGTAKRS